MIHLIVSAVVSLDTVPADPHATTSTILLALAVVLAVAAGISVILALIAAVAPRSKRPTPHTPTQLRVSSKRKAGR